MNSLSLNNLKKKKLSLCAKPIHSRPTLYDPVDAALQAPLSIGPSRQEHWSGLCPPPWDLPDPRIEPASSASQADSLPLSHQENPKVPLYTIFLKTFLLILISSGCSNEVSQPEQLKQQTWHSRLWRLKSGVEQVGFWGGLSLCPLTLERLQQVTEVANYSKSPNMNEFCSERALVSPTVRLDTQHKAGYRVLYCNRFIILLTQIICTKQPHAKK